MRKASADTLGHAAFTLAARAANHGANSIAALVDGNVPAWSRCYAACLASGMGALAAYFGARMVAPRGWQAPHMPRRTTWQTGEVRA